MAMIMQIADTDKNLSSFMKGIKITDLAETLNGKGPFTILAPVNLAFGKLKKTSYEELLKPANKIRLSDLLSCFILPEKKLVKDFINGQKLKTIHGTELLVSVKDGEVRINGAKILSRDRQGFNGVVHSVDTIDVIAEQS